MVREHVLEPCEQSANPADRRAERAVGCGRERSELARLVPGPLDGEREAEQLGRSDAERLGEPADRKHRAN